MKIVTQEIKYPYKRKWMVVTQILLDRAVKFIPRKKKIFKSYKLKVLVVKPDNLGDVLINYRAFSSFVSNHDVEYLVSSATLVLAKHLMPDCNIYTFDHFMHNRSKTGKFSKLLKFLLDSLKLLLIIKRNKYNLIILGRLAPGNLILPVRLFSSAILVGSERGGFSHFLDEIVTVNDSISELENQKRLISSFYQIKTLKPKYAIKKSRNKQDIILAPNSGDEKNEFSDIFWIKELRKINPKVITILGDRDNKKLAESIHKKGFKVQNLSRKLKFELFLKKIEQAKIVLTIDSFPSHYSAYVGSETHIFFKKNANHERWGAVGKNVKKHVTNIL